MGAQAQTDEERRAKLLLGQITWKLWRQRSAGRNGRGARSEAAARADNVEGMAAEELRHKWTRSAEEEGMAAEERSCC